MAGRRPETRRVDGQSVLAPNAILFFGYLAMKNAAAEGAKRNVVHCSCQVCEWLTQKNQIDWFA